MVSTVYAPPVTDTVVWLQLGGVCTGDVPQRRTVVASSVIAGLNVVSLANTFTDCTTLTKACDESGSASGGGGGNTSTVIVASTT